MAEYIDIDERVLVTDMRGREIETTVRHILETNSAAYKTADVQPVRHGRDISNEAHGHIEFKCSLCGCELSTVYGGKNDCGMDGGYFNYCPNCGAKMDGGDQK